MKTPHSVWIWGTPVESGIAIPIHEQKRSFAIPVYENYHIFFQGFTKTLSLNMSAVRNSNTNINKIPEMLVLHFRYFLVFIKIQGGFILLETDSYSQNTSSTCQSTPAYLTAAPSRSGPSALSLGGQSQVSWHGGPALGEA